MMLRPSALLKYDKDKSATINQEELSGLLKVRAVARAL